MTSKKLHRPLIIRTSALRAMPSLENISSSFRYRKIVCTHMQMRARAHIHVVVRCYAAGWNWINLPKLSWALSDPYILKPVLFLNPSFKKIAQEIYKLRLQILEELHIKTKKNPKINRMNFENSDNVLKYL